jgi:hypothetical protein
MRYIILAPAVASGGAVDSGVGIGIHLAVPAPATPVVEAEAVAAAGVYAVADEDVRE